MRSPHASRLRLADLLALTVVPIFAIGVAAFSGCGGDAGSPTDPGPPVVLRDSVVFRVSSLDRSGSMRLRWVGSADGPVASSPEQTARPWVGYGRPFEISWQVWSRLGEVRAYRWRASQLPNTGFRPVAPDGTPQWENRTALSFLNDRSAGTLLGEDCDEGDDCPLLLRFDSGLYDLAVLARDATGREIGHVLQFEVNYPPESALRFGDAPPGSGVPFYPLIQLFDADGTRRELRVADGDTVSAGGVLLLRMDGFDRLGSGASASLGDSFCCDQRLDIDDPEVRHQVRVTISTVNDQGGELGFKTSYSSASESDTLGFVTGPFDMEIEVRTQDEHGRPDPTPATMRVVGGFPPRVTAIVPGPDDVVLLRDPASLTTWAQNTVPYTVETGVVQHWDDTRARYWDVPVTGSIEMRGAIFRFGLRFESEPDPRETDAPLALGGTGYGGVARSWAYRYQSEFDPGNDVQDGDGFDSLDFFTWPAMDRVWDMAEGISIFVPDRMWTSPDLFDPEGDCLVPGYCGMGTALRRNLGVIQLEVVGKSTSPESTFRLYVGAVRPEASGGVLDLSLSQVGRVSAPRMVEFPVLLGLEQEGSSEPVVWPGP